MGSAAAYHLAARGQRVLGLEKFTPAHDKGSSHGGSRIIRQSYFEDPAYVPLLLRAYELWDELATDSAARRLPAHRRAVHRTAGLPDGRGQPAGQPGVGPAARGARRRRDPVAASRPSRQRTTTSRSTRPKAGFARPEMTVQAHLDLAEQAGADPALRRGGAAMGETPGGVTRAGRRSGTYTRGPAGHLPGRVGAAAARRLRHPDHRSSGRCCTGSTRVGGTGAVRRPPDLHRRGRRRHADLRLPGDRRPARRRQGRVLPQGRRRARPETIDRTVHEHEISEMRDRVAELLPALRRPCLHSATCMYSNTPDEHFVIARHPDSTNVTVACGFSGHGFKFVPVVGRDPRRPRHRRRHRPSDLAVRPEAAGDRHDRRPRSAPRAARHAAAADYYTNADVFAAEQEPHLRGRCGSARSAAPTCRPRGSSGRSRSAARACCVVRGRDGLLRAFLNVCRHRGAQLCTEAEGAGEAQPAAAPTTPGPTRWTAS